ncbi:MAG: phage tail protein [Anaerolineae bacterium]|nr:phage tail protein [Anaerolineae bacterium]
MSFPRPDDAKDPAVSFHFALEVSGKITGYFTAVDGIGSESEVAEHKITDKNKKPVIMKVPGRLTWTEVTLKRGITDNRDVWDWRKEVEDGSVASARANGSIMMYDQTGTLVAQWDFINGWPSKVSGPGISSENSEIAIEEITIVHEGITRTT